MRNLPVFDSGEIREIVQRCYGIKVIEIEPHRRVYRLTTNLGVHFFKPFHLSEARLKLIVQAKEHLLQQGFTELCSFVPALNGQPYVRVGQQLFYMTKWVEGHPANYHNPFELRQSVQVFARFHNAASGFGPPEEMLSYLGKWPTIFAERLEELRECRELARLMRQPTALDLQFLGDVDFYLQEAEKAIGMLKETEYMQMCNIARESLPFCHHDPAHHNVLITKENQTVLIDFDYLIQDLHLHDLASLVIRNGKSSGWNLKRAAFLLKSYAEVREVDVEELAVVHAFITFPYDIWNWARWRYLEEKPLALVYYAKEWERKTRDESERQQFLAKLLQVAL